MQEWQKISGLLCVFGLVREIRPSEPFVTEYLLGPWRNISETQVNQDVYPVGTYSYLSQLIIAFLITDFFRYKPIIFVCGLSGIVVWSILLWTTSLRWLQISQLFYGTYMAAEVSYFTYIYAKVDKKFYPQVTSHTRAAMLIGKLIASITAQLVINLKWMNYKELNYITLSTQIFATIWVFTLPHVNKSLYFHRNDSLQNINDLDNLNRNSNFKSAPQYLWLHFKNAYTNWNVLIWSIWYSLALCGYLQVISYIQLLWKVIAKHPEVVWNGAVDAVLTFLGAIFALFAGYLYQTRLFRNKNSSLIILSILSLVEGLAILLATWSRNIFLSYLGYVIFGALYAFSITVTSTEVAQHLEEESFGLVFGINTFFALVLQTFLTVIVISTSGFQLDVYDQYTVYSFYYITIGIFSICCLFFINLIRYR